MARQAAKAGLTQCGSEWLIQALDPFHDTARTPTGYPDTNSNASVIQCIKQSYQIVAPNATGNFDCRVDMMPWINPITMNGATSNGANSVPPLNLLGQQNPATNTNVVIGGVQIQTAPSGTLLELGNPTVAGTSLNAANTIPAQYYSGNSRVVSMAMEIVNTTSDLNRQGLVTLYRIPIPQNDDATTVQLNANASGDTRNFDGVADVIYIPHPPTSIANAQLFAGTKAWDAAQGTYQVAGFNTPDNPANGLNWSNPAIYLFNQTDPTVIFSRLDRTPNGFVTTAGNTHVGPVAWTQMDLSGAFFTGLSNSTTLTVNYVVYVERFPTQDDLDLIVVAKRSPEYDIKALEAYSEIYQSLPVGVPFGENGWGDWFDTIANTASSVLGAIPHPYAQAGALLIKGAKGVKDSFDQPASDVRVGIPDAPPMKQRTSRNVNRAQLTGAKSKLKKVITREAKFENRVRNDLRGVGKIVRGKKAPRAPKF